MNFCTLAVQLPETKNSVSRVYFDSVMLPSE